MHQYKLTLAHVDSKNCLTFERVDFDGFTQSKGLLHVLPFDALNAKAGKAATHVRIADEHCADTFLTAFLSDQIMGMSFVWRVFGHT